MFGAVRTRLSSGWLRVVVLCLALAGAGALAVVVLPSDRAVERLTATDRDEVAVLDFSKPFSVASPPPGWRHRTFWFTAPMQLAFVQHQGETALRCETKASGSILGRYTDLDVTRLSHLEWRWFVEVPITSERDERTREGDDHPVRLFLEFRDADNGRHAAEIIWGNSRLQRGDTKFIGTFPHHVADGGAENIGRWRDEIVDLVAIYRKFTGRQDKPRLTFLAVFCDSDNTGTRSVAYTSSVRLRK